MNESTSSVAGERRRSPKEWWWKAIVFLLGYIPGTPAFKQRLRKAIVGHAHTRSKRLREIKCFNQEEKRILLPRVRHLQNHIAEVSVWENTAYSYIFLGLFLAFALVVSLIHTHFFHGQPWPDPLDKIDAPVSWPLFSFVPRLAYGLVAILSFLVLGFLVLSPYILAGKYPYFRFTPVLIGWPIIVFTGLGWTYYALVRSGTNSSTWLRYFTAAILQGGKPVIAAFVFSLLAFVFITLITSPFRIRKFTTYPVATLADGLIEILRTVEASPKRWNDLERGGRRIVHELEQAAVCAECYLFCKTPSPDPATVFQLRQKAAQAAAGFRSLKYSLLTSPSNMRGPFIKRIKSDLIAVVTGDWNALAGQEAEASPPMGASKKSLQLLVSMLRVLRTLVSGGIPLGLYLLLRAKGVVFTDPVNTYITIGVYLWAVVTLLSLFDPLFAEKLTGIKTITGYFSRKKTNDDDET